MKYEDDILYIPVLEDGDKLYHYTSAAGLQGICEKQFWVTESNFLNDSSEFQIGTRVFCEMLEKHFSSKSNFDKFTKKLRNEVNRIQTPGKLGEKIAYSGDYVISFCLDNDSILMWSEYSDFVGYCMKFDFQKLIDSFSNKYGILHGAVIYDHDEQLRCAEKSFAKFVIENEQDFEYMKSWEDINSLTDAQIDEIVSSSAVICNGYNMFF